MRLPVTIAAAALVLALAGCGGTPVRPRAEQPQPSRPTAPAASADLLAARRAAGIADCPATDAVVPARADGLPDVALECLGGGAETRLAGLRGMPLVINVWAQWCGPCRQEAPHLTEAAARTDGRVRFLGIDFADPQPDRALAFAAEAGWRYPQLADPQRRSLSGLGVTGLPQTILVAPDGRVVHRHPGPLASTDDLLGLVHTHLGVRA